MRKLIYSGSLTDDINFVNEKEEGINKLLSKQFANAIISTCFNMLWIFLAIIASNYTAIFVGVMATNSLSLLFRKIIKDKINSIKSEINIVKEAFIKLYLKNNFITNLKSDVTYESLKNAVIISNTKRLYNGTKTKESDTKSDIDQYIEVITSNIYFLDINNQINALREIKQIVTSENKKNIFGLKVKSGRKSSYIKNISLQEFDEKDFPKKLPEKVELKLK